VSTEWEHFRLLGNRLLRAFLKKYRSSPKFGATFSTVKVLYSFCKTNGLRFLWATFSSTYLVIRDNFSLKQMQLRKFRPKPVKKM
jgi:hypothetical protein